MKAPRFGKIALSVDVAAQNDARRSLDDELMARMGGTTTASTEVARTAPASVNTETAMVKKNGCAVDGCGEPVPKVTVRTAADLAGWCGKHRRREIVRRRDTKPENVREPKRVTPGVTPKVTSTGSTIVVVFEIDGERVTLDQLSTAWCAYQAVRRALA